MATDEFNNQLNVGDLAAKIFEYNKIQIGIVKLIGDYQVRFEDGKIGNYCNTISLTALGIAKPDVPTAEYPHDALGNSIAVGDAVYYIGESSALFHSGVVEKIGAKKVTVRGEVERYGSNRDWFLRYPHQLIKITSKTE